MMKVGIVARSAAIALIALGCSAEPGQPAPPASLIDADFATRFGPFHLAPGEELSGVCVSWTLGNDEPLMVSAVEMASKGGFHHSNWFYVPEDRFDGPDGIWPCADRGFSAPVAAATGGVLFAQSTQAQTEIQRFADGVVIPVSARARVVADLHLLNTSGASLDADLSIGLHTVDPSEADTRLSGLMMQYEQLALPPMSRSLFRSSCAIDEEHLEQLDRPVDFSIYYVLPHYHALGTGMVLEALDKEGASKTIFENSASVGDPLGKVMAEPISLSGYDQLRFSCAYDNPRGDTVGWGIGDQEMCVLLAFTDSPNLWAGVALDPSAPVMVDNTPVYDADCMLISYPSSHSQ
jgi:hypothetical protein